jgi:hypothetical protein
LESNKVELVKNLVDDIPHLGFFPKQGIPLEGAFAGHPIHLNDADKELQQRAVGQAGGKAAIILLEENAGDIAAQCATTVNLVVLLRLLAGAYMFALPRAQILVY